MSATASRARAEAHSTLPRLCRGLALAAACAAAPGVAAPGRVVHATASRAYLDRGSSDGLAPGQSIALHRRGTLALRCTVSAVSEHTAACDGPGARPGDEAELPAHAPAPPAAVARLEPLSPSELALRRSALAQASVPKLEFHQTAARRAAAALAASATLEHGTWASTASSLGPYHSERLDLALRTPAFRGFDFEAQASAVRWTRRPASTRQPIGPTQLLVRQLELSRRPRGGGFAVELGRIWPWHAPGLGTLDGAQAGFEDPNGGWEAGVIAGVPPDLLSTLPSLQRPTFGGYAALLFARERGDVRRIDSEAQASVELGPQGPLARVAGMSRAWFRGDTDASVSVRAAATSTGAWLELAELQASARTLDALRLHGGVRYAGPLDIPLARGMGPLGREVQADASATWGWSWGGLGLEADGSGALESGLFRGEAGPELSVPKLFGEAGGLQAGYRYGLGWLGGHSAHLQVVLAPAQRLRVLAAASYFSARSPAPSIPAPEVDVFAAVDYGLAAWLRIRGSLFGRIPVDVLGWPDGGGPQYAALTASAALDASF